MPRAKNPTQQQPRDAAYATAAQDPAFQADMQAVTDAPRNTPAAHADPLEGLSREELLELLRQAKQAPVTNVTNVAPDETNTALAGALDALAGAIHASRAVAAPAEPEPRIPVTSTGKSAMTLTLFDQRANRTREANFDRGGVTKEMTRSELEHLYTQSPHLFRDGHLSAPDFVPDSGNTIADVDAFVASLGVDEIESRVAQITSVGTLFQLYHALEDRRIQTVDEHGNPIMVEDESGTARFAVREVTLPPKARLVHSAVVMQLRRRAKAAGGAHVS